MTTNAVLTNTARTSEATLREVVERLAPLERLAGSDGEREAAEWIAERLTAGGAPARVEEEQFDDGYPDLIVKLAAASAGSGLLALTRPGRALGGIGALVSGALIVDDISNGKRPLRRAVSESKTTWNVVGDAGDAQAERTLVVLAHHDAARTGKIFEAELQHKVADRFPGLLERVDTSPPQWWIGVLGPVLVAAAAASGRRSLAAVGTASGALATYLVRDIARSPVVPGANDNLTAVALLVALAEALRERPLKGLRVLLVSCGAEEVLQGGIYGFRDRHLAKLDRERTWVLNFDTIGSPELVMLEGEGPFLMEDYFDRGWRDVIERVARRDAIPIRRGMRSRASTDAVIPSRMGFPTACFASIDRYKSLSNYHLMSDVPENLRYATTATATDLAEAVARELAASA